VTLETAASLLPVTTLLVDVSKEMNLCLVTPSVVEMELLVTEIAEEDPPCSWKWGKTCKCWV
jgi:hypothetical protein